MVKTITRSRSRWLSGSAGLYDVTNRTGEGSRPGREDYALILSHDPAAAEPEIDWSAAHMRHFEPVSSVDRTSRSNPAETVYHGAPTGPRLTLRRVL